MGIPSSNFLVPVAASSRRLANATAPKFGVFPTAAKTPPAAQLRTVLAQMGTGQHRLDSAMEQAGGERTWFQRADKARTQLGPNLNEHVHRRQPHVNVYTSCGMAHEVLGILVENDLFRVCVRELGVAVSNATGRHCHNGTASKRIPGDEQGRR